MVLGESCDMKFIFLEQDGWPCFLVPEVDIFLGVSAYPHLMILVCYVKVRFKWIECTECEIFKTDKGCQGWKGGIQIHWKKGNNLTSWDYSVLMYHCDPFNLYIREIYPPKDNALWITLWNQISCRIPMVEHFFKLLLQSIFVIGSFSLFYPCRDILVDCKLLGWRGWREWQRVQ